MSRRLSRPLILLLLLIASSADAAVRPESGQPWEQAASTEPGSSAAHSVLAPRAGAFQGPLEPSKGAPWPRGKALPLPRVQAAGAAAVGAGAGARRAQLPSLRPKEEAMAAPSPPLAVHYVRPGPGSYDREVGVEDLRPVKETTHRRDIYYQIPEQPRAVALLIHGCAHAARNFWPQSDDCPDCRGMPEQLSHTLQAMRRGYAVISVNSLNASTGCWSWWDDCYDVRDLIKDWLRHNGLARLPLYGVGVSSGSAFALKLPRFLQFSGILSEALAVTVDSWGLRKVDDAYPPTVFASMLRDVDTVVKITAAEAELRLRGSPVEVIAVHPRQVYSTYFSDRFPSKISEVFSREITRGLRRIDMIDKDGNVLENPRYTDRPWLEQLQEEVPELKRGSLQMDGNKALPGWPLNEDVLVRGVWSLMNLAFAEHEIISDYCTAAFIWFETLGAANLNRLVAQFTYGLPPGQSSSRQRSALEGAAAAAAGADKSQLVADPGEPAERRGVGGEELSAEALHLPQHAQVLPPSHTGMHPAEAADLLQWQQGGARLPRDAPRGSAADAAVGVGEQRAQRAAQQAGTAALLVDGSASGPGLEKGATFDWDQQLLQEAHALRDALDLGAAQQERLEAAGQAAAAAQPGTSPLSSLIGGPLVGAAAVLLLAALLAALLRKRRAGSVGGLLAGTVQATHPAPSALLHSGVPPSRLSIIPGVKEAFDLTEVVEASGSPYSARRRNKTAFTESPHKSPHKYGAGF